MTTIGRPTKYKPEYPEQAFKLCLLGATDKDLSDFFEVSEQTLNTWKHEYPAFLESLRDGKEKADAEIVNSLYHKAKGFTREEEEIKVVSLGSGMGSEIHKVPVEKFYPPDATSIIFWLKNRHPEKWRDRIETRVQVDTLPPEEINEKLTAMLKRLILLDKPLNEDESEDYR